MSERDSGGERVARRSSEAGLPDGSSAVVSCAAHPGAVALYRCDGCGRLLCAECARPSTRLVLCAHCGELALPLAAPPEESGAEPEWTPPPPPAPGAPIDWRDLALSPLRGRQAALLAGIAALLAGVAALESSGEEAGGCVGFLPRTLLLLLVPGLMGDVARHAAAGFADLEEWPDYSAPAARLRELALFALVGLAALLPAAWVGGALGCADRLATGAGLGPLCWFGLAAGLALSALLWPLPFAAAAATGSFAAAFALRDHVARFRAAPRAAAATAALGWTAMVAPQLLRALLPAGSLPGVLAEALPGAYGTLMTARAAGLLRRRTDAAAGTSS